MSEESEWWENKRDFGPQILQAGRRSSLITHQSNNPWLKKQVDFRRLYDADDSTSSPLNDSTTNDPDLAFFRQR